MICSFECKICMLAFLRGRTPLPVSEQFFHNTPLGNYPDPTETFQGFAGYQVRNSFLRNPECEEAIHNISASIVSHHLHRVKNGKQRLANSDGIDSENANLHAKQHIIPRA